MHSLKFPFEVLSLTGIWLPLRWKSMKYRKFGYYVYSSFAVLGTYIFVTLQLYLLLSSEFELNLFVDIMFTLLTAVSVCFKMMNFIIRRKKVCNLNEMLFSNFCLPKNREEMEMQMKTDLFVRNFTIIFNMLGQATLFCLIMTPLLQEASIRDLPFRVWLPYDLHNPYSNYWITYVFELIPLIVSILVNVTTDVIVSGFLLQACTQLDILGFRLMKLPDHVKCAILKGQSAVEVEREYLQQAVIHHDFVIKFAEKVTKAFDVIIVEQYFASVLLFSVIVYQFTMGEIPVMQKIMAVGYIICMTGELFAYCWFGNEITLKSMEMKDIVYMIDWTGLSTNANKSLIFIMMRTLRPIIISYGDLVVLNIESFKGIMKITYSAFNLLKESGEK